MKKNKVFISFQKSIIFFIPLLITSCVGGATTINSTDGSKIRFKSENVTCKNSVEYPDFFGIGFSGKRRNVECTANGVRTFLTGDRTNFSEKKMKEAIEVIFKNFMFHFYQFFVFIFLSSINKLHFINKIDFVSLVISAKPYTQDPFGAGPT